MKRNIYAIIPARRGSKGLPGKNIRLLTGKPLIAWTIEAAEQVPEITKVIVNTDDEKIAEVSRTFGAEIFIRPQELAQDLTLDLPVFAHHLTALKEKGELPDMIVDLRATAPLRRASRIREGIALLAKLGKEKADSVRAVSKAAKHPYKMWKLQGEFITPFLLESFTEMKEPYNAARHMLPPVYQNNGCMNAFWPETVLEKHSMTGERIAGFVMEDWESINIDTEMDFMIAGELMRRYGGKSPRKDFDRWNTEKKQAHSEQPRLYTVREVWWCRLGVNIGSEQDGSGTFFLRPVVIVRGFGADTCMIVPLTTSLRQHPLRIPVGEIQGENAAALLSQIRVVDTRRLVEKIGFLKRETFMKLQKAARVLF